MKSKVSKLDVDELVSASVHLSKLSDIVKNDVVRKDVYNAKIKNIEDKIFDITNVATTTLNSKVNVVKNVITKLATTAALNAKINEVKNKIPNITKLATTTVLTAVETKIPDHDKYITTPELNKLTAESFPARLAKAN